VAIQAIAVDKQDRVYAATSPDGKVYRVTQLASRSVLRSTFEEVNLALAFFEQRRFFVATGDQARSIAYRETAAGSRVLPHRGSDVRSLAVDAKTT